MLIALGWCLVLAMSSGCRPRDATAGVVGDSPTVEVAASPTADADAREFVIRSDRLREGGHSLQAATELGKALALEPENASIRLRLAELYQTERRWAAAEAEYRRALSLERGASAFVGLADLLRHQSRFEEAIAAYRWAMESDPRSVRASDGLCRAQMDSDRFEAAVDDCGLALRLNPRDVATRRHLGGALLRLGRHQEAAQVLLEGSDVPTDRREEIIRQVGGAPETARQRPESRRPVESE